MKGGNPSVPAGVFLPHLFRTAQSRVRIALTGLALAGACGAASEQLTLTSESGDAIRIVHFDENEVHVNLDGRLDEPFWRTIQAHDNMRVIEPDTMLAPRFRTQTRFFYTDKGLYVGVWNEQPPDTMVARFSSRDDFTNRDSWGLTLDTSGRGLYGYWFTVNLGGSIMDGKVAPEREFSREWDGPWRRATAELDDGWSLEMFLPWSMMTMPRVNGERELGFWIDRKVAHIDERWGWPALPFTSARFMSALAVMKTPGVDPKQQYEAFPFTAYTYDNMVDEDDYRVGADLSWRPSTDVQLTATVNPDFGAVESDDVVINLTAFESFFPEKRLFFLEGNEVFITSPRSSTISPGASDGSAVAGTRRTPSLFNREPTTVVNTRRIGGSPQSVDIPPGVDVTPTELGRPTDLLGSAKVTGQLGQWRYGALAAVEDDVRLRASEAGAPVHVDGDGRNFAIARLLHETSDEGRRAVGYIGTFVDQPDYEAYVHGIDTHLLSRSGKLKWDSQLLYSDVSSVEGYGGFTDLRYTPRQGLTHSVAFDYFDDKLDISDLGFLRRNDAINTRYTLTHTRSRGLKRLRSRRLSLFLSEEFNTDGRVVRSGIFLRNSFMFHNRSELRTELDYFPPRWDDRNSRGNGSFRIEDRWVTELAYGTDTSRILSLSGTAGARQEDLGGWTLSGSAGFTLKPTEGFSLDLDAIYRRRDGWLVHQGGRDFTTFMATDWQPRMALDLFFNAQHQLRLTMQWAGIRADEQRFYRVPVDDGDLVEVSKPPGEPTDDFTISRITAQLRYRWEIAPMSDLFVVWTRGSNLGNRVDDEFDDLFHDALTDPVIDLLVIKLRYRFGS